MRASLWANGGRRVTMTARQRQDRRDRLAVEYAKSIGSASRHICTVAWCKTPSRTRQLCNKHYERLRMYGDATIRFGRFAA